MSRRLALTMEYERVPQAPLMRAVADGLFHMTGSDHPRDSFSRHKLASLPQPHLVVVVANERPEAIASARYLHEWCNFAVVQAGQERRDDYLRIARGVPHHRKVLLVETTMDLVSCWVRFFDTKLPLELVVPV